MGKTTKIALVGSFGLVLGFTALQAIGDDLSAGPASKDTVPAPTPERTMVASVPDSAAVEADDQTRQCRRADPLFRHLSLHARYVSWTCPEVRFHHSQNRT